MKLKEMKPGDKGRIVAFIKGSGSEYRRRLFSLGVLPNTDFEVVRIAPLGDPIEIKVRGSFVSIRKEEIDILEVEKL